MFKKYCAFNPGVSGVVEGTSTVSVGGVYGVSVVGGVSLGTSVSVGAGVGGSPTVVDGSSTGWKGVGEGRVNGSGVMVGPGAVGGGSVTTLVHALKKRKMTRILDRMEVK